MPSARSRSCCCGSWPRRLASWTGAGQVDLGLADTALAAQQTLADRLFEDKIIPTKVDFSVVVDRTVYTGS